MTTVLRRERDLRRREALILDAAEDLLVAHGYLGLNFDRLAERVEYSKGTLYNHFDTKEDIVLALGSRHLLERVHLFERAAAFAGRSRERMVAIGMADDVLAEGESTPFQVMQMAKTPSLWEKTSPARRAVYTRQEARCSEILEEVVRAGVADGDVAISAAGAREVSFGLMTMCLGTHLVSTAPGWSDSIGLATPRAALRANQHRLLDGIHWHPLFAEWDYAVTETRIQKEIFPRRGLRSNAAYASA